jgi:hypothetical protein
VLVVLGLGLLALQLDLVSQRLGPVLPGLLALAGAGVLGAALHTADIDEQRKKPNSVHYIADLDAEEARWYSMDPAPDEWTRYHLGDAPVRAALPEWAPAGLLGRDGTAWQRPAPMLPLRGPDAELLEITPVGEGRRLRLRIVPAPESHFEVISFPDAPGLSGFRIDGRDAPPAPDGDTDEFQLIYFAMPVEGVELEVVAATVEPLQVYLRSNLRGLPRPEADSAPPRPAHLMEGGRLGDLTRLQRTVEFP